MSDANRYSLLSPAAAGESTDLLAGKNAEEAIRRVQALLADWLRMENVVVLTAAGCSVAAGGRLMAGPEDNNLECLVLDVIEHSDISEPAKSVVRWKRENDYGKGSFESWLSYLFNASSLTTQENTPIESVKWKAVTDACTAGSTTLDVEDERILRDLISKAIYAECALELDRNELTDGNGTGSSGHIPFLAKLIARDSNLGRTHLFTLNYDTLFEQALEELGIQYFDGFSGKALSRFDPSVYGLDVYYPGDVSEGRVRRFDKFIHLYKLHGSLHWYVGDDGIYRARHRDLAFAREYRKKSPQEKAALLKQAPFSEIGPFGILPTSQKFTQTLGMPYSHLFRLFHNRLNQPQTFLMVLGYGFGDDHVTRIIETALTNPSLIMLVVEPNPDSIIVKRIRRYQSLGQRAFVLTEKLEDGVECSYNTANFADFSHNIMPDVKWLDDFKRLRQFEKLISTSQDTQLNDASEMD